ncbi:MAG: DUF3298 and DUF4163 domain-containing protein [Candidatus Cloacimonadales bacterium]|nr:DUF3298 and DUF4163 domain-containing protein [Candidatus Cloacimonadales bacterium]
MNFKLLLFLFLAVSLPLKSEMIGSYFSGKINDKEIWLKLDIEGDSLSAELSISDKVAAIPLIGTFDSIDNSVFLQNLKSQIILTGKYFDRKHEIVGKMQLDSAEYELHLQEFASVLHSQNNMNRLKTTVEFPVFVERIDFLAKLNEFQQKDLVQKTNEFFAEGLQQWQDSSEFFNGYEMFLQNEIEFLADGLVSLLQTDYEFTGGAHGNTAFHVFNFSPENDTLETINLSDFFIPESDYLPQISNLCISNLKQQNASYVIDGSVESVSEEYLKIFTFNRNYLIFYFEQYIMGCYAEGTFRIAIPWQELKSILQTNELTDKIIKK